MSFRNVLEGHMNALPVSSIKKILSRYNKELDIRGYSKMKKSEVIAAVKAKKPMNKTLLAKLTKEMEDERKSRGDKGKEAPKKEAPKKEKSKASKPDFLDLDKDGNKKEPMKQAARQAKGKAPKKEEPKKEEPKKRPNMKEAAGKRKIVKISKEEAAKTRKDAGDFLKDVERKGKAVKKATKATKDVKPKKPKKPKVRLEGKALDTVRGKGQVNQGTDEEIEGFTSAINKLKGGKKAIAIANTMDEKPFAIDLGSDYVSALGPLFREYKEGKKITREDLKSKIDERLVIGERNRRNQKYFQKHKNGLISYERGSIPSRYEIEQGTGSKEEFNYVVGKLQGMHGRRRGLEYKK